MCAVKQAVKQICEPKKKNEVINSVFCTLPSLNNPVFKPLFENFPGRNGSSERKICGFSGETGEIATQHTPEKSTFVSDLAIVNRLRKNSPPVEKSHQTPSSEVLSMRSTPDATAVETTGFEAGCESQEPGQSVST